MGSSSFSRAARWFILAALALGATSFAQRSRASQASGAAPQATPAAQDDWPQYHYAANQQNFNPKETVLGVYNVNQLVVVWKYTTGGEVFSSPAVVDGILYAGSNDHNIYALNASTGALLWKYTTGKAVDSSPAVFNGIVYATSGDGYFYALDASTGSLRWKFSIGASSTSPSVANGVVYVTGSGGLNALSATTGTVLWNDTRVGGGGSPVAIANGLAYGIGVAVNAYNGKQVWFNPLLGGGPVYHPPAVVNGVAYTSAGNMYALEASTGNYLWEYPGDDALPPAMAGSTIYIGSGNGDASIFALKADTGTLLWQYPTSFYAPAGLTVANGVVYASSDEDAFALDATTGALLWTYAVRAATSPVIANGMLYVGSYDDNIYAFGLSGSQGQ